MVRFYKREQINDDLWNGCVNRAVRPSVKGYTWYLDIACKNWSALILNDYEAVLPLPVKSKLKISYLLQPLFIRLMNIYSDRDISAERINKFLDAIPSSIKLVDINLNVSDVVQRADFVIKTKPVQLLDLKVPYETIALGYKENVIRNLRKAKKNDLVIVEHITVTQVIEMFKTNVGYKIKDIKEKNYKVLKTLMDKVIQQQCGFTAGVFNKDKKLVAAAFFMLSEKDVSFFNGSSTPLGKTSGAMFFLFDHVFKKYATQKDIFDFEGSSIKGIADFNKNFGAKDYVYLHIKKNSLPYLLKKWSGKYL
jgi:hypothetical protein